ncbi:hypothetical protein PM082_023942 [Marasmius tenuissimus]|nr:hypothetical protein PM082_023942 [Marasmius tenuissimus]
MAGISLVQANLASFPVESALYGLFLLLSIISLLASFKYARHTVPVSHYKYSKLRLFDPVLQALRRPIFVGGIAIVMTVSGHWLCGIIRLFDALTQSGNAEAYYADISHPTQLAKNIFLSSSAVIGDALIIYRLWIVWTRKYYIVVFPIVSLLATTASGIIVAYFYRLSPPGTIVFSGRIAHWIIVESITSTCINVYCSTLISWRIWKQMRQSSAYVSPASSNRPLSKVLIVFIESAALYALWQLVFLILLFLRSNIQFTFVDGYPVIAGISFMSINARMYLSTWSPDHRERTYQNANVVSPFAVATMNTHTTGRSERESESYVMHPVRPVAVQVTVVGHEEPPDGLKNNSGWTAV